VTKHRKPANHVYGGAPHSLRKAQSVTDNSGHIQFLGWQPTIGEFITVIIWPLLVPFLVALLIGPLPRWFSRAWNSISDRYASLSVSRRAKQITALKLRIRRLAEYGDRQIILRHLRGVFIFVVYIASAIVTGVLIVLEMTFTNNTQTFDFLSAIWEFLDQIFEVLLILGHTSPKITPHVAQHTDLFYLRTFFTVSNLCLALLLILSYFSALNTLQEMSDFSDPTQAIQRLEERIKALKLRVL
jgi:hypothetical protein